MTDYSSFSEEQARAVLQAADLGEFVLVTIGRFHPGREGEYAGFDVICARDPHDVPEPTRLYSLHLAVILLDGDLEPQGVRLINGHYDLTLDEASDRLRR